MGIRKKGKRKIIVNEKAYWWFCEEDSWREPLVHVIADDHSFIAECSLYCPVLNIIKDHENGCRRIPVPTELSEQYLNFTPQYISELIQLGSSKSLKPF